jgi:hypothetical protein
MRVPVDQAASQRKFPVADEDSALIVFGKTFIRT